MPAKFDRCVRKVRRRSGGRVNPYAVCNAALKRRYGHARAAKVRYYRIVVDRLGYTARAYDARGRSVNYIYGGPSASISEIRAAARKAWPDAKDKTP